jgi:DNA-binding NarL/FixJ family response regulator
MARREQLVTVDADHADRVHMSVTEAIQIVVVEDHPSMRSGLELLLANQGFRVIGSAGSVAEGRAMIAARRPDVAVVDGELGDGSGTELARTIAAGDPPVAVVLYMGHVDQKLYEEAVDSGALGVVLKTSPFDDLARAVRAAAAGSTFVDESISTALRRVVSNAPSRLSKREAEVLGLLAHGQTSGQVAGELFLSERTVDAHVRNACQKLGARGRLHAVVLALGSGELALGDLTRRRAPRRAA